MKEGDTAPNFELDANDGTKISLESFKGNKNVVLCFYPKNHLFGCPSKKVFKMAESVISSYDDITSTDSVSYITVKSVDSRRRRYSKMLDSRTSQTRVYC